MQQIPIMKINIIELSQKKIVYKCKMFINIKSIEMWVIMIKYKTVSLL